MGYYTDYFIEIIDEKNENVDFEKIVEDLEQISGEYIESDASRFLDNTNAKWYGWEKDIKTLSLKYPNLLFKINGIGEEYNDIWRAYIKNGKIQFTRAKLIFDNYDSSKLT